MDVLTVLLHLLLLIFFCITMWVEISKEYKDCVISVLLRFLIMFFSLVSIFKLDDLLQHNLIINMISLTFLSYLLYLYIHIILPKMKIYNNGVIKR